MKIILLNGKISKLQEKIKDETGLDIEVKKSTKSKKISLRIDSKLNKAVLSIPRFCSLQKSLDFVVMHKQWIAEKLRELPEKKLFEDGEIISLFGEELKIVHSPNTKAGVHIKGKNIIISGSLDFLHRRTKDFIIKTSKEKFYNLSKQKADEISERLNRVFIKDTKSRWGSCSSLRNINYSWRIALAPYHVFEYIVAHEVSHLKHQDHSQNFWNTVKELCPKYEISYKWLQKNGKDLHIYE